MELKVLGNFSSFRKIDFPYRALFAGNYVGCYKQNAYDFSGSSRPLSDYANWVTGNVPDE